MSQQRLELNSALSLVFKLLQLLDFSTSHTQFLLLSKSGLA